MSEVPPLGHLINVPDLQKMADAQYRATGMPVGIISALDNSIIVGAGWQDICVHFHRVNDASRRCCEISDNFIKKNLKMGQATSYKCLNGLWDIGTPIIVADTHLATLFLGQFFYEKEIPDRDFFKSQAKKFDFNVTAYLAALDRVPVFSQEKVDMILAYNMGFAGFISSLAERSFLQRKAEKELQEKQEQIQQAQKMEAIGTLAGGVAHDFNNILSAIIGYTELALFKQNDKEKMRNNLEQVLSAAIRAKDLIRQILTFSRKGPTENQRELINIHNTVLDACKLLRQTIPSSINFNFDIDPLTGEIAADITQIHQVVINLCTNALQALPEGEGLIAVNLKPVDIDAADNLALKPGRYALLSVQDSGQGMPAEVLERIFEPFFTTKKTGEGTGMGLAIIHGIVKQHGGEIFVESSHGHGTVFRIYFPLAEDAAEPRALIANDDEDLRGTGRILIVDDEAILAELVKETLESFGYQVTAQTSPLTALSHFETNPENYDLIITDQTMPAMTGDVLTRKVFEIRNDIPVLICTGHSSTLDEHKAAALGVSALLMKPLDSRALLQEVRKALSSSHSLSR